MTSYQLFSPSGNITALMDNVVTENQHAIIASKILQTDPTIEQVGFISEPTNDTYAFKLDMMGGEFCANGARSAALAWMLKNESDSCTFKTSGLSEPISAIRSQNTVTLKLPGSIVIEKKMVPEGTLIDFTGIRMLVTEDSALLTKTEEVLNRYAETLMPAIGLIYLEKKPDSLAITPWVRVESTRSFMQESSCGSGSIAACIASGYHNGDKIDVLQPSSEILTITFAEELGESFIYLKGDVRYLGEKFLPV